VSDLEQIRPDLLFGRRPPEVEPELTAARAAWAGLAGAAAAANSYPARISGDVLVVVCSSAPWAGELTMLRRDLEPRLAVVAGRSLGLRFEVGDVPEAPTS
jgi:predicted nucleic acid-binding Zn ribbon protein